MSISHFRNDPSGMGRVIIIFHREECGQNPNLKLRDEGFGLKFIPVSSQYFLACLSAITDFRAPVSMHAPLNLSTALFCFCDTI